MSKVYRLLPLFLLLLTLTLTVGAQPTLHAAPGVDRAAELKELDATLIPHLRKLGASEEQLALIRQKYDALLIAYAEGAEESTLHDLANALNQTSLGKPGNSLTLSIVGIFRYCPQGARATFKVDRGNYFSHFLRTDPDSFLLGYTSTNNRWVTHTTPEPAIYFLHSVLGNNLRNHTAVCR